MSSIFSGNYLGEAELFKSGSENEVEAIGERWRTFCAYSIMRPRVQPYRKVQQWETNENDNLGSPQIEPTSKSWLDLTQGEPGLGRFTLQNLGRARVSLCSVNWLLDI